MRKDSPHVPVWLDFDGSLERMFGIIPGEANVVVLDTAGRVHSVLSGNFTEQEYAQFVGLLDQLRLAARPDLRVAAEPGSNTQR
jgi:predicted transcriptional regulator